MITPHQLEKLFRSTSTQQVNQNRLPLYSKEKTKAYQRHSTWKKVCEEKKSMHYKQSDRLGQEEEDVSPDFLQNSCGNWRRVRRQLGTQVGTTRSTTTQPVSTWHTTIRYLTAYYTSRWRLTITQVATALETVGMLYQSPVTSKLIRSIQNTTEI